MRVLFVVHIGETLGHLARALSVAREFVLRGADVHIAVSHQNVILIKEALPNSSVHVIEWEWSHNEHSPDGLNEDLARRVLNAAVNVKSVITMTRPDIVIGFPGLVSSLVARTLGVPHVSVLHAPYLAPIWSVPMPSDGEAAVLTMAHRMIDVANATALFLHSRMGTVSLRYDEYLATERIFVPAPQIELAGHSTSVMIVPFIRASIGPVITLPDCVGQQSCYVTFGSGNPCNISDVVAVAADIFDTVVVTIGRQPPLPVRKGMIQLPFIASESVASRVGFVISHGGLGTVGTFNAAAVRQLILPTELDQAATAIYAARLGIAINHGVEDWPQRTQLGRMLPRLDSGQLINSVKDLRAGPLPPVLPANGASAIADVLGV